MSVRRENIEEQAMRLRGYVSEAVRTATGVNLPMTQTLDQMVRASAKAGVMLSISTEAQMHAIEMLSNQLRLHEISLQTEREQLRAEVAGLRTGYEAYERVNAELKAENEALRDDLEQIQYDANAWRNSEESVWIEVFNSEGDDPFISAISGQITVEQLALIQAEIIEYREDYFEKGSGLYVFRCAHYQAHHDNVGMTEPAHWETDFESYSPFPWEDEAAAMGKVEQS